MGAVGAILVAEEKNSVLDVPRLLAPTGAEAELCQDEQGVAGQENLFGNASVRERGRRGDLAGCGSPLSSQGGGATLVKFWLAGSFVCYPAMTCLYINTHSTAMIWHWGRQTKDFGSNPFCHLRAALL